MSLSPKIYGPPPKPKIIQLLVAPDNSTWQGRLLGLRDNGVTYELDPKGKWQVLVGGIEDGTETKI